MTSFPPPWSRESWAKLLIWLALNCGCGADSASLESFAASLGPVLTVVVDDTPTFFLPRAIAAFARVCPVRLEGVDGVGLLPLRLAPGPFATALAFRRFGQRHWPTWLLRGPRPDPFAGVALPEPRG